MHFSYDASGFGALSDALRLSNLKQAVSHAIDRALPDGALEEEFTEALLFVLSIRLNQLTGGATDMTFSARCHQSSSTARRLPTRIVWAFMGAVIDLYCANFRGEIRHCETAWVNHAARIHRLMGVGSGRIPATGPKQSV